MTPTVRVALADDQPLVRSGLRMILEGEPDLEIVGESGDGAGAVDLVARLSPDVLLLDVQMPGVDGLAAMEQIASSGASTRVLMLTTFDLDEYVFEALRAGASGFLLKDTLPDDLLAAVRVVAAGDALLAPSITKRLIEEFAGRPIVAATRTEVPGLDSLTERETEVLLAVARGLSNAEIAEALFMSHATAKTHVSRLLTKLYARDRAQLVMLAYEAGLAVPGGADPAPA